MHFIRDEMHGAAFMLKNLAIGRILCYNINICAPSGAPLFAKGEYMKLIRYTSVLTAFLMLASAASALPASAVPFTAAVNAAADEQTPAAEGTLGEKLTWTLDGDGTLTVTGSGDMADVSGKPFGSHTGKIQKAVLKNTDSKNVITAVGAGLFSGCTALAEVTLPETVTAIGNNAFLGCTALQTVTLPKSLESVGGGAFKNSGLTALTLPGCTLGNEAFSGCTSLKTVTVGEGTESIPSECFRHCKVLESVTLPDSVKEIRCGAYSDQGAFADCPLLKTVSIGKNIGAIASTAFRTTGDGILEVTFREGVTAVPEGAFKLRTELAKVILPETLTAVNASAFEGCTSLTECDFPALLKEIGRRGFAGSGLTAAALPGCSFGAEAFVSCSSLKTVTVAEGAEIIPSECFRHCAVLESVTLPDSVKEIRCGGYSDQGAFADCPLLKTVSIGKNIGAIASTAFRTTGEGILEVTFREGVTAVPESAFKSRTELAKVVLPETLTAVNASAFDGCSSLTDCNFPASVKEIGRRAFAGTGLTAAELPGCSFGAEAFASCGSLKTVTVAEGAEVIPSECFRRCAVLESVTLPDSVKEILCGAYSEQGAFADCPLLKTVSLGKNIEAIAATAFRTTGEGILEVTFREGVTAVPEGAFKSRTELAKLVLPETLTAVNASAFDGCSSLKECNFPASVKEIGRRAFAGTGLTAAELPGCSFGAEAFASCGSLKTVTVAEGAEIIPSECFRRCSQLESVTLPDSVREIQCGAYPEQGAFADCPLLKTVSIGKNIETIAATAFRTTGEELEVIFREGVTAVPDKAFDKSAVTKIVLPKTVTEIGANTVSGCAGLKEICIQARDCGIADSEKTIPAGAAVIGYGGSTAQAHAEKYGYPFELLYIRGDVNGDDNVSVDDAQTVLKAYTERIAGNEMGLTAVQIKAGDVDENGVISVEDAQLLLKYYTENTVAGKKVTWEQLLGITADKQ